MSRRKPKKNIRRKKPPSRSGGEWIGGRLLTPFYITEGPEPYRPEIALWMEMPEGLIVGQDMLAPGDEPGALGRALQDALRRPLIGAPRRPSAIRVADPDLAAEVRAVVGDRIPVTVAATPELDELLELMSESMAAEGEFDSDGAGRREGDRDSANHWEEPSYLEAGRVSPAVVAELFSAAELLHHAAPWKVANDSQVLRLDIPELGVDGACVSIIGALGESIGLLIFPSLTCFDAFARAAFIPPEERRRIDVGTSWLSLTFERGADLPASMRREVAAYGWPVADALSYPRVEHRDRGRHAAAPHGARRAHRLRLRDLAHGLLREAPRRLRGGGLRAHLRVVQRRSRSNRSLYPALRGVCALRCQRGSAAGQQSGGR